MDFHFSSVQGGLEVRRKAGRGGGPVPRASPPPLPPPPPPKNRCLLRLPGPPSKPCPPNPAPPLVPDLPRPGHVPDDPHVPGGAALGGQRHGPRKERLPVLRQVRVLPYPALPVSVPVSVSVRFRLPARVCLHALCLRVWGAGGWGGAVLPLCGLITVPLNAARLLGFSFPCLGPSPLMRAAHGAARGNKAPLPPRCLPCAPRPLTRPTHPPRTCSSPHSLPHLPAPSPPPHLPTPPPPPLSQVHPQEP